MTEKIKQLQRPFAGDKNFCQRKSCLDRVYVCSKEAEKLQLCKKHYSLWRLKNKKRKCRICKKEITNRRNKKYCSRDCKDKGQRTINDDSILGIKRNAAWKRTERWLRKHPLGLASICDLNDLCELYRLHFYAYYFDRQKNIEPQLKLRLTHIYPCELLGSNSVKNLMIAPEIKVTFAEFKSEKNSSLNIGEYLENRLLVPIQTSLLSSMTKKIAQSDIIELIERIKMEQDISPLISNGAIYTPDNQNIKAIINHARNPFIYKIRHYYSQKEFRLMYYCLLDQIERKKYLEGGFWSDLHLSLLQAMNDINPRSLKTKIQLFELLAIAIFHAILHQDKEQFIQKIINKIDDKATYQELLDCVVNYTNKNFALSLNHLPSGFKIFLNFYNGFFTNKVSDILLQKLNEL